MRERACQELKAGPKTEQVTNIWQPGSVELGLFHEPQASQLLLALQIWKNITRLQSDGLSNGKSVERKGLEGVKSQ